MDPILRRHLFTLIILFSFLSFSSYCQDNIGTLTGRIVDAKTLLAVSDANIIIKGSKLGTVSDGNGSFTFNDVVAGTYVLVVSHISYSKSEKKIQVKKSQKSHINIFLTDSVFNSKAVEIIASDKEALLNQAQRIDIINAKAISLAPILNVNQILDYSPGMISNNTIGIYSSKVVVTMRGMPSNDQGRTLVLMDGMPLNKSDGGSVNWNLFNKNNIEEIKIIKGPGPAKYGSGAMGGVIEIISKKPSEKITGDVSLQYGTYNTFGTDLRFSGKYRRENKPHAIFWGLSGNATKSDGYVVTPDQFRTIEDTIMVPSFLNEYNISIKAGYDWDKRNVITVQSLFFDDMRGNGVEVFDEFGAYSKHRTLSNLLKYDGLKGFFKWQSNFYINNENYFRVYEYMNEGEYKLYEADAVRRDLGVKIDVDLYRFTDHKISFGLDGKSGMVEGSDTYYTSTDIINNAGKMDVFSCYMQDEISFFRKKVSFNMGLRYDYASFHDAHFTIDYPSYSIAFYEDYQFEDIDTRDWSVLSPRLSLRYNSLRNFRLFVSYARGFRAPKLDDMTRTGSRRGTFAIANPGLKPEIVDAFEIGGDLFIISGLRLSVSAFYSIGKDFMYYTSTGDTVNMFYRKAPVITMSNIGKVRINGVEVEMKYRINENISIFSNYTLTDAIILKHNFTNAVVDSNLTGKYLTDIPRNKASGGVNWENKILNLSVLMKYYGKTWINEWNAEETEYLFTDEFDGYFTFNINLEKTFLKHFSGSLQIENLFNEKYINSNFQECPGRMVFVKFRYFFKS